MSVILFILSYTLGAVVTYGAGFAYWQSLASNISERDYGSDGFYALKGASLWPVMIIVYLFIDGRKPFQSGFKFY